MPLIMTNYFNNFQEKLRKMIESKYKKRLQNDVSLNHEEINVFMNATILPPLPNKQSLMSLIDDNDEQYLVNGEKSMCST